MDKDLSEMCVAETKPMEGTDGKVPFIQCFMDAIKATSQPVRFVSPSLVLYDPIDKYLCLDHSVVEERAKESGVVMVITKPRPVDPSNKFTMLVLDDPQRFVDITV